MAGNNELRNIMQEEACKALLEDKRVIVNWATGAGKSRVAIKSISSLIDQGKSRFLLLVVESTHKKNWRNEFVSALGDFIGTAIFESITVECYASLAKYQYTKWDLIIADEAHHLRSDNRCDFLSTLSSERVLCLSATLNERGDGDLLMTTLENTFGHFKSLNFNLKNAIDTGVLAEPAILVHILDMDKMGVQEFTYARGFKKARKSVLIDTPQKVTAILLNPEKYKHIEATVRLPMRQAYEAIEGIIKMNKTLYLSYSRYLDETSDLVTEKMLKEKQMKMNAWLQAGLLRKSFLANCKTQYAKLLLKRLGKKKFICFCNDVTQAEKLEDKNIINSKKSTKANNEIIEKFNTGEITSLFAVGMLKEGTNLAGIETGVIIQLDGKERQFIQKFGRALRSSNPEQHVIVFKYSQDREYFKKAFDTIAKKFVQYVFVPDEDYKLFLSSQS